ncbi:hypothetical protein [Ruoffia sp. FAM 26254]|uniref:hypothetical protein n=1 Tax=Ruoffia sp. FAM 26254 TaxID=3259518 RepID=UPI00388AA375
MQSSPPLINWLIAVTGCLITISTLAEHLDDTARIIKEDITFLSGSKLDFDIDSPHKGYRIMMEQTADMQEYFHVQFPKSH